MHRDFIQILCGLGCVERMKCECLFKCAGSLVQSIYYSRNAWAHCNLKCTEVNSSPVEATSENVMVAGPHSNSKINPAEGSFSGRFLCVIYCR